MDIPTLSGLWLIYPNSMLSLKETLIIMRIAFLPRSSEMSSGKLIFFLD